MTREFDRGEVRNQAEILKDDLRAFAAKDTKTRENRLFDIVSSIKNNASLESILELTSPNKNIELERIDYRPYLYSAARKTTNTLFTVGKEKVKPWEGGFTVISLRQDGTIPAGITNPRGRVYKEYGQNLYPYALTKAMFSLHLYLSGKKGGLGEVENIRYLQGLGFRGGENLFLGEAIVPGPEGSSSFIGASGCELQSDYINSLLPRGMQYQYPVDFLAGRADHEFALQVAVNLKFSEAATQPVISEPKFFSDLRFAH